jgi:cyclophilin family peptidyl-prolyl cis-trans isomerase
VALTTTQGRITLELDPVKTPLTVQNFLRYVQQGYYQDTLFHRVIPGFVVQGGGYTAGVVKKPGQASAIELESNQGLSNLRGTVAMARTNEPHSATSQFFVNVVDNQRLDFVSEQNGLWGYAVFGKVVEGMDVVDKIAALPTGGQGPLPRDVPTEPVVIESAELVAAPTPAG